MTFVVGIKARLSQNVAGKNDVEALRRAQQVAKPLNIPVMIHMGQTFSPLPAIFALLKPGDIVTHIYAPPPHGIFDEAGRVLPEVIDARRRGVWFDIGNGRTGHITWAMANHAMESRLLPDTVSTDWTTNELARTEQVIDFGNVLVEVPDARRAAVRRDRDGDVERREDLSRVQGPWHAGGRVCRPT